MAISAKRPSLTAGSPGRSAISSTSSAAPSTDIDRLAAREIDGRPRRQIYGRKTGPRLRAGRKQALTEGLVELGLGLPDQGLLDPCRLFGASARGSWLEIGFGGGEQLLAQALEHPEIGFVGVEPFIPGVAQLLAGCREHHVTNVRIVVDDARLLLRALPDASLDRAFVLFPDPWPKTRHHKRRIVNTGTLAELARVLRPGGMLDLATDDVAYGRWMLEALIQTPRLHWLGERADDWRRRPADLGETRYARKALAAGRMPIYLRARREPDEQDRPPLRDRGF